MASSPAVYAWRARAAGRGFCLRESYGRGGPPAGAAAACTAPAWLACPGGAARARPAPAALTRALRSTAEVCLARTCPGDCYLLHPAAMDACMQLGPAAGAAQAAADKRAQTLTLSPGGAPARATPARLVTRVVVGLAAIQAGGGSAAGSEGTGPMGAGGEAWGGAAAWAAGALSRPLADGSTRSSHWLLGGALAIAGLQVLTGTADMEQRAALDLQPAADPSLELA